MVEEWEPSEKTLDKMYKQYPEVDIEYDKEKFIDHYLSTGGVSADWNATFRNWIRRSDEYNRRAKTNSTSHAATSTGAVSDRRNTILSVAKKRDRESNGSIKRLPKRR